MARECVVGVDFGTLSGRAVVVAVDDGAELGSAVHEFPHAVIDRELPASGERLPPDWALQDPEDYLEVLREAVPAALREAGVDAGDVIGIAIDFTASTPLPALADGTPLCALDEFRERPHAYPKLWKHHAAQEQADRITALAEERGEPWLARYGGRISSEWQFAKALQVLEEDPELYERMERWVEGADWIVWQLSGEETRNLCTAGYKAIYQDGAFPDREFLAALDERFAAFAEDKVQGPPLVELGSRVGGLTARAAEWTGLPVGAAAAGRAGLPRRRSPRARGRGDRPAGGHRGRRRQRRRARHRAGGPGDRARPAPARDGHLDLPHHQRRAARRGAGHVRRRPGGRRAGPVGLRGRPERRRRHLRLVRRELRPAALPRAGVRARRRRARLPVRARGRAARRRARAHRARLAQRQPVRPRRPPPQRRRGRAQALDAPGGHLPRADRGDRLRDAEDRGVARGGRDRGEIGDRRRRPAEEPGDHAVLLRRAAPAAAPDRLRPGRGARVRDARGGRRRRLRRHPGRGGGDGQGPARRLPARRGPRRRLRRPLRALRRAARPLRPRRRPHARAAPDRQGGAGP